MAAGSGVQQDPFVVKLPQGRKVYVYGTERQCVVQDNEGNKLIDLDKSGMKQLALFLNSIADGRSGILAESTRSRRHEQEY